MISVVICSPWVVLTVELQLLLLLVVNVEVEISEYLISVTGVSFQIKKKSSIGTKPLCEVFFLFVFFFVKVTELS